MALCARRRSCRPGLAAVGGGLLVLCCLFAGGALLLPAIFNRATATAPDGHPAVTNTPCPRPPNPGSINGRSWWTAAGSWYRTTIPTASPARRSRFTRFNQDGTLIGFTGCKNFNGSYQTEINRISIATVNLSSGACPEASLQVQEDMLVAILRSARSFLVADTTLQISGDAGFLNYSLTPPVHAQPIPPPQAVIQSPTQALVGEIVSLMTALNPAGRLPSLPGSGSLAMGTAPAAGSFNMPSPAPARLQCS